MASRLGTPYQNQVNATGNVTVGVTDDAIIATSGFPATITLPDPATCKGDDARKFIGNLSTSGGTATLATAAGTIVGASSLLVGEALFVNSNGLNTWGAENKFSAEGLTSATISTADSKGVSSGTRASVADSKAVSDSVLASTADSKGVSAGTAGSTADSKGVSSGSVASVADSKALSGSVVTSSLTSRVSSKGG